MYTEILPKRVTMHAKRGSGMASPQQELQFLGMPCDGCDCSAFIWALEDVMMMTEIKLAGVFMVVLRNASRAFAEHWLALDCLIRSAERNPFKESACPVIEILLLCLRDCSTQLARWKYGRYQPQL